MPSPLPFSEKQPQGRGWGVGDGSAGICSQHQFWQPEFDSCHLHGAKKELTLRNHSLNATSAYSTHLPAHIHVHLYILNKSINNLWNKGIDQKQKRHSEETSAGKDHLTDSWYPQGRQFIGAGRWRGLHRVREDKHSLWLPGFPMCILQGNLLIFCMHFLPHSFS